MNKENAPIDKAIDMDTGGKALLKTANVGQDAGVVIVNDKTAFFAAAKMCQWDRGKDRSGNLVAIQLSQKKEIVYG